MDVLFYHLGIFLIESFAVEMIADANQILSLSTLEEHVPWISVIELWWDGANSECLVCVNQW